MENLQAVADGVYRILIPFEDLHTTVYIVLSPEGAALIDAATYPEDITSYVLPALEMLGIVKVTHILLTHHHGDHAGGLPRLIEAFPEAAVCSMTPFDLPGFRLLEDGEQVMQRLQTLHLPGHTRLSCGYLDLPTGTLLSGDCLQLAGVGKYVHGVGCPEQYRASVEKLKKLDIRRIVAAHEYVPLGSLAEGREAVEAYLDACLQLGGCK